MPNFEYLYARLVHAVQRLISLHQYDRANRVREDWMLWQEQKVMEAEREADYYYTQQSR